MEENKNFFTQQCLINLATGMPRSGGGFCLFDLKLCLCLLFLLFGVVDFIYFVVFFLVFQSSSSDAFRSPHASTDVGVSTEVPSSRQTLSDQNEDGED